MGLALALDPSLAARASSDTLNPPNFGRRIGSQAILRFPASKNPEIFQAQETLVESWAIVRDSFVDSADAAFAKRWENELAQALARTVSDSETNNVDAAYGEIDEMLGTIGDPYTRFVKPKDLTNFNVNNDGELQGVGLLIASDPASGRLLVLSPIQGSPAERAGILPGDEIASINGRPTRGVMTGEVASAYLRGRHGTSVTVKLATRSDQIPGVPGIPDYRGKPKQVKWRQVKLVRDSIVINPVYSELISDAPMVQDQASAPSLVASAPANATAPSPRINGGADRTGYIKLTSFNQRSSEEMVKAIQTLKSEGASRFILDLRDNPGGLVNSATRIASLWLQPNNVILRTITQGGLGPTVVLPENTTPLDADDPLVVLVNKNSASASEILAGALKDNGRAQLLGENAATFGKGKIQSVFELGNKGEGGALLVTVAKYQTPSHKEIDSVGLKPDKLCSVGSPAPESVFADIFGPDIQADPCVMEAEKMMTNEA